MRAGCWLTIDLDALAWNYGRLCHELNGVACAAVVKADGYGMGIERVGPTLARAGARDFFVAQIGEGIALRKILAETWPDARIAILNGIQPGTEADFIAHDLRPVLNSLGEIALWRAEAGRRERRLPAILHVDTGINRLGLPEDELARLAGDHGLLDGLGLTHLMSHLACADDATDPMNFRQLERFREARRRLPPLPGCFANSCGIFFGPEFHFDLGRPGVALYGVNPVPHDANPMRQVVVLKGRILQIREIDAPETVGYGASHRVSGPSRIATVAAGYADGYLRYLSNRGRAVLAGMQVPVVGRVSMDLITLDVSAVPERAAYPGATVDLLGPKHDVDALAQEAETIGYEILTSLGKRYHRRYLGG